MMAGACSIFPVAVAFYLARLLAPGTTVMVEMMHNGK